MNQALKGKNQHNKSTTNTENNYSIGKDADMHDNVQIPLEGEGAIAEMFVKLEPIYRKHIWYHKLR